jgi:outer membrane protein TolC
MRSCLRNNSSSRPNLASLLPILLALPTHGFADTLPAPNPEGATTAPLTIQACRQIALGQQPAIAAAQASLKAAMDRAHAVESMRVPNCLARDLPIRRKQAALGVMLTEAGLTQAQAETMHGVTASYLGALYAAQQVQLADQEIRARLKDLETLVTDPDTRKRRRDVILREHHNLVKSFLKTLDGRVPEAEQGQRRALAALREAMGVGPDFVVVLPNRDLPCPLAKPPLLGELVALSLARRGEMVQASTLVEIVCLEVDAQAMNHRPTMRTFASSSDIHAKLIPSNDIGGVNFHPTMIGPEMPAYLNGSREARVQQAHDYLERTQALAAKTRNLIALEVEDLYRQWVDKSEKAAHLGAAYREAKTFSDKIKESFNKQQPSYPNVDEVINAGLVTTRLQLEWKEAHYQSLLALAALERATVGGFAVDFDAAPPCDSEPRETPNGNNGSR